MNAERFLTGFGHIVNAPGGIRTLRDLVFHLAFAGELVEHSRGDVAELIESLALAESSTGRSRRVASEPPAGYYQIPPHWQWVNIGLVGHDWGQVKPAEDFTYIDVSAIDNKRGIVADGASVVAVANAPGRARKIVKKGSVIYSTVRPYLLNIAVIERDFEPAPIASTAFAVLHPHNGVEAKYVYYFLRSPAFVTYVESVQSGIAYPAISDQKFFAASLPLAPSEEQERIVAKVDELMALCDQLEAQQQKRERFFPVLSHACHTRFVEEPLPVNLNRIFDEVGTVSPQELRKTILTLAVQGKLVSQDPNDEPAKDLIARLANQMSTDKRRNKFGPAMMLEEAAHSRIPDNWMWARFQDVAIIASNLVNPSDYLDFTHLAPDNIEKGNGVLLPCSTVRQDKVISSNHRFYPGQIVYSKIRPNLAKVVLVDFDGLCSADMYPIDSLIDAPYLHRYMLSESFLSQSVRTDTRVAMPKINQNELNAIAVPVPPLAEQRRIVSKVDELMTLVGRLEAQLREKDIVAEAFAKACIASFTGIPTLEKKEKMKAPKTELISFVTLERKPSPDADAPLAKLLEIHGGEQRAKDLWQQSGLLIENFYQQLKSEIARGWIAPPTEAQMKIVDET